MRSPVPSVASEAQTVLPPRPHLSSARSHSKADSPEPATPFAELLDSAPASEPPAPRQSERPERTDRADASRRADDRSADAEAAKDSADARDANASKAADAADDTRKAEDSKDSKAAGAGDEAKADAESTKTADAGDKPKPDAELIAVLAEVAPAVVVPQAAAAAVVQPMALAAANAGIEADALAALQAAGAQAGPQKPAQPQTGAQGSAQAKTAASAGAADPLAAVPPIESDKDGQTGPNGDKAAGDFRRAVADLLTKLDTDAPVAPVRGDSTGALKAGADAVQNLGIMTQAHTANAAAGPAGVAASAPAQAQAPAVPLSGLAVEIVTQAQAGKNHFEIRLDPPELGRINVKIDVDRDGNVSTRLVVDRADTLDLLKRDASTLERALQQAGLKTSDNALEFSLRQHAFAHDDTAPQNGAHITVSDDDPAPLEALRQGYGRLLGLGGGLDIRV